MERVLREWAPLTDLFNKLPSKVQNGIFTTDLKLTCVDVLPEFLALGTNFGIVYWYDRKKKTIQKLRCENSHSPTTTVKVISTVDYMVACGNKDGNISIFQVPKSPAESLPESLKPKNKQIERYTVADLHKSPVTSLEWSKNGMKLFSGDKTGHIILTEIDFYMHICKSVEILNESYEVVQLNFYQQMLLVSTTYRTIICKKEEKWKVSQVGKKDRKILGNFGGVIHPNSLCPNDAIIYCTRPGLRIWESDLNGNVLKTLLFKDIVTQQIPEIEIINPISETLRRGKPQKEKSFGLVLPLNEESLVIYNSDFLFVLNPKTLTIEASLSNLRNILSVGVHKNEIFVLEGERSLIRLSYVPEYNESYKPTIPTANSFLPITLSLKELTTKLQTTSIISAIPPLLENVANNELGDQLDEVIINAEEATESPRKEILKVTESYDVNHDLTEKINETYRKLKRLNRAVNSIEETNESILYKHHRHKKTNGINSSENNWVTNCNDGDSFEGIVVTPTVMNVSTVGILPDLRSPDAIKTDIENKEKILADILCLNTVKIPEETLKSCIENENNDLNKTTKETTVHNDESIITYENKYNESDVKTEENDDSINCGSSEKDTSNSAAGSLPKSIVSFLNKMNSPKNLNSGNGEESPQYQNNTIIKTVNKSAVTKVPDCLKIPFDWKLNTIQVKDDEEFSSDNSLKDWELL